jgi:hypothetical protein
MVGQHDVVASTTLAERGELTRAARSFLRTESGSATLLLCAAVVALLWANAGNGYERFWSIELSVNLGGATLTEDLRHWVNDGLMVVFFFAVGMEISREAVLGEPQRVRLSAPLTCVDVTTISRWSAHSPRNRHQGHRRWPLGSVRQTRGTGASTRPA